MIRTLAVLGGAVTIGLATIGPSAGTDVRAPALPTASTGVNNVLRLSGTVDLLAADGFRAAAAHVGSPFHQNCLEVWNAHTGALVRFREFCDERMELALGGARVLWTSIEEGLHVYEDVNTATLAQPKPISVYTNPNDYLWASDLRADGSLIVFAVTDSEGTPTGTLYRLRNHVAESIRSEQGSPRVLAVDRGRIAVRSSNGSLELLSANGTLLHAFRLNLPKNARVALGESQVAIQKGASLAVYDSAGRLDHTWPVVQHGSLADASRGVAVYVSGTALHLVRLSDGHERVIRVPGTGPVHAQIEPTGLFYSYAVRDVKQPGRIAFVSFSVLLARFG